VYEKENEGDKNRKWSTEELADASSLLLVMNEIQMRTGRVPEGTWPFQNLVEMQT
jgi:hypothetical protein